MTKDWTNVTLDEYMQICDLLTDGYDKEDLIMNEIQILYHTDPYKMSIPDFHKAVKELEFLSKDMPKMKVKDSYNLNGNVYYLHKSLSEFKMGQYVDFERIAKTEKGIDMYPDFIALFLTPEKEGDYGDGYDVEEVAKEIRKYMSVADAFSVANFFLRLSKAYTVRFLWYSMFKTTMTVKDRKRRREIWQKTRELMKTIINGDVCL